MALDVVVEDVADIAKSVGAVGADQLAVDRDLIAEQLEQDPHHLRERQRRDREVETVQPQRRHADQQRRAAADRRAP